MGGHKGYGLAAMVEILSTMLSGAAWAPLRAKRRPDAARYDVGHFLMAVDPGAFRDAGDFRADLDDMIDSLRASRPRDAAEPVLVAGDPERACAERYRRDGIPLPEPRIALLGRLAAEAECEFVLQPRG
jgi:LDH2 family malate/lactate/ureidoglycolate dehydrogenase